MIDFIYGGLAGIILGAGALLALAMLHNKRVVKQQGQQNKDLVDIHADLVRRWAREFDEKGILNYITFIYSETPDATEGQKWTVTVQRPGGKTPSEVNTELQWGVRRSLNHANYLMNRYGLKLSEGVEQLWQEDLPKLQEMAKQYEPWQEGEPS